MSFFKNLFGSKNENSSKEEDKSDDLFASTQPEIPVEELFMLRFKNNGGKFLYCENTDELRENFLSILVENDWFECNVMCNEKELYSLLNENKLTYEPGKPDNKFALVSCEALISEEGSILFSSAQLREKKTADLPDNVVVVGKISQLVSNKSNALALIKKVYGTNYPSNITTISSFKAKTDDDFLNFGSSVKNLYLLLLENM